MSERNTIQRSLVLEAVNAMHCHATADEVYAYIAKEHPSISRGTVYRNLNRLAESGDIRKLEIPGEADRYDHICGKHYHLKCVVCRSIFDVDMEYINDLESGVKNRQGFDLLGYDLYFKGVCPQCKNAISVEKTE